MLFSVFRRKPLFDKEITDWIFNCFSWALNSFGSDIFYEDTSLITLTDKYFPCFSLNSDEDVKALFEKVKEHAGMKGWKCRLEKQTPHIDPHTERLTSQNAHRNPSGTFSVSDKENEIVITYNPDLINDPNAIIATFAHELSHYLCLTATDPPPGGKEFLEPAVDLLSVFTGFGIFSINSAYKFSWYNNLFRKGWEIKTRGYLSQFALIYILAIFCTVKSIDKNEVLPYLNVPIRSYYKKSLIEIEKKHERIEELKMIKSLVKQN